MWDDTSWAELVNKNPALALHLIGGMLLLVTYIYVMLFLSDGDNGDQLL